MRTLYVVTHPEATHHVDDLVGGWYDSSLAENGQLAAASIARALGTAIPVTADVEMYSSDLRRAAHTASAIGEAFNVDANLLPGLREKSYGDAEGKLQSWLDERSTRRWKRSWKPIVTTRSS